MRPMRTMSCSQQAATSPAAAREPASRWVACTGELGCVR
jgi:hypothetical protein